MGLVSGSVLGLTSGVMWVAASAWESARESVGALVAQVLARASARVWVRVSVALAMASVVRESARVSEAASGAYWELVPRSLPCFPMMDGRDCQYGRHNVVLRL